MNKNRNGIRTGIQTMIRSGIESSAQLANIASGRNRGDRI
jgi:hypothetical protein